MNPLLKKVKNITQEACLTIALNTHRTKPDNQKDAIVLKNLMKEAEERLLADYDKRFALPIIEKLEKLSEKIDHNYNLESLIIFVNSDFAEYTRLPIAVEDRVVLDDNFATRDLVRAMHQTAAYYVLVISRQQARLIEAYNDKVVAEVKEGFPMQNELYVPDKLEQSMQKDDKLVEEFFNRVDKQLWKTTKDHPLPVLLATETRNAEHYRKVTDKKDLIIGHINRMRDDEEPHHVVSDAWEVMLNLIKERNAARIAELKQAVSTGQFLSDFNDIWRAINEGRGQTLFVKQGFFQPALVAGHEVLLVDKLEREQQGVMDDVVDEMIELNLSFGGDTVFIKGDELENFQNLALVTRY